MPPSSASSPRAVPARAAAWVRGHRRLAAAGGAFVLAAAAYPWAVGTFAARTFASRATARLGRTVGVARGRAGLGHVTLSGIRVDGTSGPELLSVERVEVPMGVAFGGRSAVRVSGARLYAVHGGSDDNVTSILERLRGGKASSAGGEHRSSSLPGVIFENARLEVHDRTSGLGVTIANLDGEVKPDDHLALRARGVSGLLAVGGDETGPRFGADELRVEAPLAGLRPTGAPGLHVTGGSATPLPTLSLTGIAGVIAPPPRAEGAAPASEIEIDLHGSYGGARETLWTAKGHADPSGTKGALALRAEQFSLDKIADVLPASVLKPENTTLDASLDLAWANGAVDVSGDLDAVGVSLHHDALAADPVENVSLGLTLRGRVSLAERKLELAKLEARVRDLVGRISGTIELPRGSYKFGNGRKLSFVPKIDLAFTIPRVPCAKMLASVPPALAPKLDGFVLQGYFQADVGLQADFADLSALDLRGKVGIDGCKVVKAPDAVTALAAADQSIVVPVEVPLPPGGAAGQTETLDVVVGPENPDFTPYAEISPSLINSIMTTEDNGFFKHHGWVSSEFKSALKRNLAGGGFRLGASSITMQMTKNVLLSQEKTLSRKLQELFLVWYLEQELPKERILELYFNAIEFGPRIYGIGAAARHYFGKKPSELNPVEGAFFSSILPSPKRRYIQYCHGALFPPWEKYVRRILSIVHQRGRLTDEEYAAWSTQPLVFDRTEATFTEKQCLDWVKTITTRPEAEPPPDLDDQDDDGGGDVLSARKLRRLFTHGHPHAMAKKAARPN
ncbi:MAG TPA: biosynthetic peptidoglycan transglycosylase [Polyangia bacterium]|nr:biosynthetic peptidoglycan transglycosylase [Polyangia bacterium]